MSEYAVVEAGYVTPCWLWTQATNAKGYGVKWVYERRGGAHAHRVYWEREHGPVPAGLELDHLCRNRPCVNPDHLEPVTHKENMRRGYAVVAGSAPGFGGRLRAARIAAGLSQADLAEAVGRSQTLVYLWEANRSVPTERVAPHLHRVLGVGLGRAA